MLRIRHLRIDRVRVIDSLAVDAAARWNWLVGPNGAGKTSVLEAIFLLGHGRSFRRGGAEALIRKGERELSVFVEMEQAGSVSRLGVVRRNSGWDARVDGERVGSLTQLARLAPVLAFEPDAHLLVAGGAEERRRYLDWTLFHVEPDFLPVWRRYHRALKQRNALLKSGERSGLAVWDQELVRSGEALDAMRRQHLSRLTIDLSRIASELVPELGALTLEYSQGWRSDRFDLATALRSTESRDLAVGSTGAGPHRADLLLSFEALGGARDLLSRGQEKAAALVLRLGQASHYARTLGSWPILVLDDLPSELDALHLERSIALLDRIPAQCWVSCTEVPAEITRRETVVFHVERGVVTPLL